uniref:Uracil phosphoribosyltransferase or UMP pyrophosphorylase n=1 Tax=Porolithon onkodes TaxID=231751 RepID=A0A2Z2KS18_9FLOR|nr:uracil phosphoribosyltransferase or UMP pyrophosphorylase [Porolithon onkodes]ASB29658.1 uracil phosphoribosyltransferase or UMP pyrophosphorylase [Porolithon onkodes]
MKLNIHLLSHPIIQSLSSMTNNSSHSYNIMNQYFKYLGFFIIYETIRTWAKIHKLTVKTTKEKKDSIIMDPKESYTIIFNNLNYVNMFQEIQSILPRLNLKLIEQDAQQLKFSQDTRQKILIVHYQMDISYIKYILNNLHNIHNFKLEQIRIACVECQTSQLIQLGETYSNLTIYTTKIIDK